MTIIRCDCCKTEFKLWEELTRVYVSISRGEGAIQNACYVHLCDKCLETWELCNREWGIKLIKRPGCKIVTEAEKIIANRGKT